MSQAGLFRGLYLAPQCATDCFDPWSSFPLYCWLAKSNWLKYETLSGPLCPMKCVSSGFISGSGVFIVNNALLDIVALLGTLS